MRKKLIEDSVESLCQRGCREVTDIIGRLRNGEPVPGTEGLRRNELAAVRRELESIMAVYEGGCPVQFEDIPAANRRRRTWMLVLAGGCVLWFGLMVAASYWGYVNRDPVPVGSEASVSEHP